MAKHSHNFSDRCNSMVKEVIDPKKGSAQGEGGLTHNTQPFTPAHITTTHVHIQRSSAVGEFRRCTGAFAPWDFDGIAGILARAMKTQRGRVELAWHLANHDFVRYFELSEVLEKSFHRLC